MEWDHSPEQLHNGAQYWDSPAHRWSTNSESPRARISPYRVSRNQLEQVIQMLSLPIVLTQNMESANAILSLKSYARKHVNLQRMASECQVPIYTIKANTISQITRTLRLVLGMDNLEITDEPEQVFPSRSDDNLDALEEARRAVEQVVLPLGKPMELLPRSARVRKMQHE